MSLSIDNLRFENELKSYLKKTKKSHEIYTKSKKVIPKGVSSNARWYAPYPLYFTKGLGNRIWDADGNEYLDSNLCMGALMAGHSHPKIVEGVKSQIEHGTNYGADPAEAHEVAELLTKRFNLDMARFSNSGTEATMHALRIARAYTGKSKIIKFEGCYHGAHDYVAVSVHPSLALGKPAQEPSSSGIPEYVWKNTLIARFNDINSVDDLLKKQGDELAAVIIEPVAMNMGVVPPEKGFLEELRKLTTEHGVALIFDEVKTGVKLSYGGAFEYFGVHPDLITVAKSIGGGFNIAAILGKKEYMEYVGSGIMHGGTFNANPVSIAASKITLKEVLKPEVYKPAHDLCDRLAKAYQDIINDSTVDAVVQWIGVNGHVYTGATEKIRDLRQCMQQFDEGMWYRYLIAMMNRGIIAEAQVSDDQWTISIQYTKEDVDKMIEAFKEVIKII